MEGKDIKQVLAVNYLLSLGHKGTSGLECWIHEEHIHRQLSILMTLNTN